MNNETALMVPEDADIIEEQLLPIPVQVPPPGLSKRLAEATTRVEALMLDGENTFHHYKYPTIAQVREKANHALTKAGVSIIPSIARIARSTRQNDKGKTISVTVVELEIVVCSEEGSYVARWIGESEDVGDKGVQKAASAAMKSWLANLLLIPVGEPENDDGATEKAREEAQRKQPPKQQRQHQEKSVAPMQAIQTAPFMQTHEERGEHNPPIVMTDYWKAIKTALNAAGYDNDELIKELLAEFQMPADLKEWVTGWFRLLERFSGFVKASPDKVDYAKSIMRHGIESQQDWDGALESLNAPFMEAVAEAIEGAVISESEDDKIPDL